MKTRADQGHIEMTTIKGPFLKRAMYVNFCLLKTVLQLLQLLNLQRCRQITGKSSHWMKRNTK